MEGEIGDGGIGKRREGGRGEGKGQERYKIRVTVHMDTTQLH